MTTNQAKTIWNNIQNDLLASQDKVNKKLRSYKDPQTFYKFLESNIDSLNIIEVDFLNYKFNHYGKIIKTALIIPEKGKLYLEVAYYPLSKKYFRKLRISISNKFSISNHYMERLIERKRLTSLQEVKQEISEGFKKMDASPFTKEIGGLDISTGFIILNRDSVSFCDLEIDDHNTCEAVMKTIITEKELTIKKKEIIDYILNVTKSETCFLATYDIPSNTAEADNIIEDTRKRTSGLPISYEEVEIYKKMEKAGKSSDKAYIKAFVDYLGKYDPNSPKYEKHLTS